MTKLTEGFWQGPTLYIPKVSFCRVFFFFLAVLLFVSLHDMALEF
jgi:hypothetical protein